MDADKQARRHEGISAIMKGDNKTEHFREKEERRDILTSRNLTGAIKE